jgi:hypothetical protein
VENGKPRIAALSRYDPQLAQQEVPVRSEMAVLHARPVLPGVLMISTSSSRVPNGAWLQLWFQLDLVESFCVPLIGILIRRSGPAVLRVRALARRRRRRLAAGPAPLAPPCPARACPLPVGAPPGTARAGQPAAQGRARHAPGQGATSRICGKFQSALGGIHREFAA